jgi:hypothetical protein
LLERRDCDAIALSFMAGEKKNNAIDNVTEIEIVVWSAT